MSARLVVLLGISSGLLAAVLGVLDGSGAAFHSTVDLAHVLAEEGGDGGVVDLLGELYITQGISYRRKSPRIKHVRSAEGGRGQ